MSDKQTGNIELQLQDYIDDLFGIEGDSEESAEANEQAISCGIEADTADIEATDSDSPADDVTLDVSVQAESGEVSEPLVLSGLGRSLISQSKQSPQTAQPKFKATPRLPVDKDPQTTQSVWPTRNEPSVAKTPVVKAVASKPKPKEKPLPDLNWGDNGRPNWAQQDFDCLMFDVAGLALAVPLSSLGNIYPLNQGLVLTQNDTPALGTLAWEDQRICIVDTAKIVMPERYPTQFAEEAKYAISLRGFPWALAVSQVDRAHTLTPNQVHWRTGNTKRLWLAGTVLDYRCAILDLAAMEHLIKPLGSDESDSPGSIAL